MNEYMIEWDECGTDCFLDVRSMKDPETSIKVTSAI